METAVEKRGTAQVNWLTDLSQAYEQARQQNRYVLLDFFSPT